MVVANMQAILLLLFPYLGIVVTGEYFAPNSPLRELARGAFLNSWPVSKGLFDLKKESLLLANKADADDCGKRLLCELAGKRKEELSWDEELMLEYYEASRVDYTSDSLFFNIAVKVGREKERSCTDVYPRCLMALPEMLKILRRQGISFEIPGEEKDCQVYFLWKKKTPRPVENEVEERSGRDMAGQGEEEEEKEEDEEVGA